MFNASLCSRKEGKAEELPQIFPRYLLAWIKVGCCSGHWGLIVGRQTLWSSWGGPASTLGTAESEVIAPSSDNVESVGLFRHK